MVKKWCLHESDVVYQHKPDVVCLNAYTKLK